MESRGFYNYAVEEMRSRQFPALKDVTYVDHAGATLYACSQLSSMQQELCSTLYANPHSANSASKVTVDAIDHLRFRILKFFHTTPDEYSVVFTSGCTAALKLLAESFSFCDASLPAGEERAEDDEQHRRDTKADAKDATTTTITSRPTSTESRTKPKFVELQPPPSSSSSSPSSSSSCQAERGIFCYLQDNHTSVQGMRTAVAERARAVLCLTEEEVESGKGAEEGVGSVVWGSLEEEEERGGERGGGGERREGGGEGNHLFVFPAQSNFSGRKYPLRWVRDTQGGRQGFQRGLSQRGVKGGRWFVVLDAASLVSTSPLDLTNVRPDFVTLSFYKIFGYPTGLGALLVRNSSGWILGRRYYGGGTVAASTATDPFCALKANLSERFEDGTLPYLNIVSLRHGLNTLEELAGGMSKISSHTFLIAQYFAHHLMGLVHSNGNPLTKVYSADNFRTPRTQGPIVNFSLFRANGDYIGYAEVDKLAQLHDIHLRSGCFCNIGACQLFLGLSNTTIRSNLHAGHVCGDDMDLIDGRPTGSVRVSFGYMSSLADAARCLSFLTQCFLELSPKPVFTAPDWFQPPAELTEGKVTQETPSLGMRSGQKASSSGIRSGQEASSSGIRSGQEASSSGMRYGQEASSSVMRSGQETSLSVMRSPDTAVLGEKMKKTLGSFQGKGIHEAEGTWREDADASRKGNTLTASSSGKQDQGSEERQPRDHVDDVDDGSRKSQHPDPRRHKDDADASGKILEAEERSGRQRSDEGKDAGDDDGEGGGGEEKEDGERVEEGHGGRWGCSEKRRVLTDIFLYPVKSCGAFRTEEWELGERGLLYDRTWMVVTQNGVALSQKREPRLCLLRPLVRMRSATLELTFPGMTSYSVPLDMDDVEEDSDVSVCTSKICNDRVRSIDCGRGVAGWLVEALERPGLRLWRQLDRDSRQSRRQDLQGCSPSTSVSPVAPATSSGQGSLSLANESQYLLVSRESVRALVKKLAESEEDQHLQQRLKEMSHLSPDHPECSDEDNLVERFRANLVIDGGLPFDEDSWTRIHCGDVDFIGQGQCSRCGMICLDQSTGEKTREPLRTLASWRGGKIYFGVYMRKLRGDLSRPALRVGDAVTVD